MGNLAILVLRVVQFHNVTEQMFVLICISQEVYGSISFALNARNLASHPTFSSNRFCVIVDM